MLRTQAGEQDKSEISFLFSFSNRIQQRTGKPRILKSISSTNRIEFHPYIFYRKYISLVLASDTNSRLVFDNYRLLIINQIDSELLQ